MEQEEYQRMYSLEENYWWFRGKRRLVKKFFLRLYPGANTTRPKVLDIGCGTGIVMKEFLPYASMHGIDFSAEAIRFCKKRGLSSVQQGSVLELPFADASFDAVFLLDVLYHQGIPDDVQALREVHRVLKKGGKAFITDSACPILWGKHDQATHALRRYTKKGLITKLEQAGFHVKKAGYFNFFLFLLVLAKRKLSNLSDKKPESDVSELPSFANEVLYKLYCLEIFLMDYISFPFGVSVFCIADKD